MPLAMGAPPSGPPPMGPPPIGAPDAKRQRTGGLVLEPEEEFLAKYSGPSKVLHHGFGNMRHAHVSWQHTSCL